MSVILHFLAKIDDLIERIPKEIAVQIRRLFSFIIFIMAFFAIYVGYKLGIRASRIPGEPLIRYTDEILRLRSKKNLESSNLKLVKEEDYLFELSEKGYLKKEKVKSKRYDDMETGLEHKNDLNDDLRFPEKDIRQKDKRLLDSLNLAPLSIFEDKKGFQKNPVPKAKAPEKLDHLDAESLKPRINDRDKEEFEKNTRSLGNFKDEKALELREKRLLQEENQENLGKKNFEKSKRENNRKDNNKPFPFSKKRDKSEIFEKPSDKNINHILRKNNQDDKNHQKLRKTKKDKTTRPLFD